MSHPVRLNRLEGMARIETVPTKRAGWLARLVYRYSRRHYGEVLEPAGVYAHSPAVLGASMVLELVVMRTWRRADPVLQELAVHRAAQVVGCAWCIDFGSFLSRRRGTPEAKLTELHRWRESDVHTPRERLVIEYAEAMSATPMAVTDQLVARLRDEVGEAALVEITALVALENMRARTNHALGITSQGFCAVPAGEPVQVA
jgi:AhpD family alkylhydroperoxidase